jgi:hypothetical protein
MDLIGYCADIEETIRDFREKNFSKVQSFMIFAANDEMFIFLCSEFE